MLISLPMALVNLIESEGGKPIQVKVDALKKVLCHPDAANIPVAIYSIAGPYGTGKSFLLNCLLHLLHQQFISSEDAVNVTNQRLENVFSTGDGLNATTEGIYITKQPYVINTENKEYPLVALFLMDTQGLFDFTHDTGSSGVIAGLSMLMSSIQFINFQNKIDGHSIQYICKFAESAIPSDWNKKKGYALFQRMFFLVRDWIEKQDYTVGVEGGKKYLDLVQTRQKSDEHQDLVEFLKSHFNDELECSLLPRPGDIIENYTDGKQVCLIKDVGQKLMTIVKNLFESYFLPNNILPRKLGNSIYSGEELYEFLIDFADSVNTGKASLAESYLQCGHNMQMREKILLPCLVHYWRQMSDTIKSLHGTEFEPYWKIITQSELNEFHLKFEASALKKYSKMEKPGNKSFQERWKKKLETFLQQLLKEMKDDIEARKTYVNIINDFATKLNEGVSLKSNKKIDERAKEAVKTAIDDIKANIPERFHRRFFQQLLDDLKMIHTQVAKKNRRNRIILAAGVTGIVGAALTAAIMFIPPVLALAVAAEASTAGIISGWIAGAGAGGMFMGATVSTIATAFEEQAAIENEIDQDSLENKNMFITLSDGSTEIRIPRE